MFSKPVSALTRADLDLVLGVAESDRLEFKRDAYGRADDDVREMLKDVSSMANAAGGYLLVGVGADAEERAMGFPGVENAGDEATRMLSSFRTALEEQILGLEFGLTEVAAGRHVIIWGIPRSTRAPHLITFKGLNQFWRRHGRQKAKMTIEEIREACVHVENVRTNLESFLDKRYREQLAATGGHEGAMLLSATPLIVRDEMLDTADTTLHDLIRNPPMSRRDGFGILRNTEPRPTLYGLRAKQGVERTELFRNGHLESCADMAREYRPHTLNPFRVAETPLNFLLLVSAVTKHLGLQEPLAVKVSIAGIAGWEMQIGHIERGTWADRRDLELPAMQFPYPLNPSIAAKHIADRIWNALELEACPLFDERGQFDPNRLAGRI